MDFCLLRATIHHSGRPGHRRRSITTPVGPFRSGGPPLCFPAVARRRRPRSGPRSSSPPVDPAELGRRIDALRDDVARARAEAESRGAPPGRPRGVRRLVVLGAVSALAAVGVGLGLTLAGSGRRASAPAPPAPTRPPAPTVLPAPTRPPVPTGGGSTPAAGSPSSGDAARPARAQPSGAEPPRPPAPAGSAGLVTVQPGQSLWSIASSVVAGRAGPAPTAAQIAPYWVRLMAANTARLPRPGDPNLIYPGQGLVLPPT